MADTDATSGIIETREDAGKGSPGVVKLWLDALKLAEKHDEKYWKRVANAQKRYRDEQENRSARFNILYSSIEAQKPALYNSTPKPDVRRRHGDEDPVGKIAAQAFERCLSYALDDYDFDSVITDTVHDSLLAGRGIPIVAYEPTVGDDGTITAQRVTCDLVQRDDFRHGPAKRWGDVPWLAVRYRITRAQATALNKKIGSEIKLDWVEEGSDKDRKDPPDVFKRLEVWKIWDKEKREIVVIAPSCKSEPLAIQPDELKLRDFYPIPRPLYDINDSTSLVPQVPYEKYRDQAEELDRITRRLGSLINCLRWRGIRAAVLDELVSLKDAEDGELIPAESAQTILAMTNGQLDRAIWIMPIERLIAVIRELVVQREAIKQVIFEITGIADIMRGETDPNETLGAQQIKAQWGSLRLENRQREVQRICRDLIRLKAEIIGEHFTTDTLRLMTGIELPTAEQKMAVQAALQQAQQTGQQVPPEVTKALEQPTWDEVKAVMASDALRGFRVDIETDSTIQADLTRAQQNMGAFVEGLAAFGKAVGPAMETGMVPPDVVSDLLTAFARQFKLGRQAEDALDRLGKIARQPQPQRPDPEAEKAQAEAKAKEAEVAGKQQAQQQELAHAEARHAMEMRHADEKAAREDTLARDKATSERGMKEREQLSGEVGSNIGVFDELKAMLAETVAIAEQASLVSADAVRELAQLRGEMAKPKEITPRYQGRKIVGAKVRQGSLVTDVVLN
jgi:hypothetical protein